ncbi:uncharacterized protein LOC106178273 [Lingula anatina]|uniref:Uncharacterized protein LOC106178273 n=1 Tax=Lingula anatina TaxID=7574 RepID=A0A1S3K2I7_LINAN|nr:uncharacterized protein LOC106178273 [Lingula anatina]|eukprot:XP_013416853.1 uncharacterized protein LOC106178273 [Lingula anatina]
MEDYRSHYNISKSTNMSSVPKTTGGKLGPSTYAVVPNRPPSGGKRGPSGPLANSSDEEDAGDAVNISVSSTSTTTSSPSTPSPNASSDYENVASPGGSSTASGPIYVRPPGFAHHGQEILKTPASKPSWRKKRAILAMKEGLKKREPTPPRPKSKKDPLPMRMRALPQSFFQQPNVPHNVSPGAAYPVLPPLMNRDSDVTEVRPVTPPEEKEKKNKAPKPPERKITLGNPDLLFKLFEGYGDEKKKGGTSIIKRGRPKKVHSTQGKAFVTGEDPFIMDAVAEKLFPQLSLESSKQQGYSGLGHSSQLHVVTLREGDKSVMLPALSREQNYSQMLSELVSHI